MSTKSLGNINADTATITTLTPTSVTLGASNNIDYSPTRSVIKSFVIEPLNNVLNAQTLTIGSGGTAGFKYNVDGNINFGITGQQAGAYFWMRIPEVINGATLASLQLYYQLNGTARTPTRISMMATRQDLNAFTSTVILADTQVTLYATTGYLAVVSTTFAVNHVISSDYMYQVKITNESGGGNQPGNNFYALRCNYTVAAGNIK